VHSSGNKEHGRDKWVTPNHWKGRKGPPLGGVTRAVTRGPSLIGAENKLKRGGGLK